MVPVAAAAGDKGNNYYVIKEGTCDVMVTDANGEMKHVRTLSAGNSCGELSLLTGQPRSATIQATSQKLVLLMVNRRMFNATIGDAIMKKRAKWKEFLCNLPIMGSAINDYEQGLLADACTPRELPNGSIVTKPGTPLAFYIVFEGSVESPSENRTFSRGDIFGHAEILQDKEAMQPTRKATKGRVVLLTLTPSQFYQLVPLHVLVKDSHEQQTAVQGGEGPRHRRQGVGAEATSSTNRAGGAKTLPVGTTKSKKTIERIFAAIKQNIIFSRLSEQQLTMLQQAMMEHHVAAGSNVITQGEKGNHFYVVDSGELDAFVKPAGSSEQQFVKTFHAGDMFGELALMYNCPRTATIQARTDVTLWSLDRVSFRLIVLEANTKKASQFESYLEKVQLLEPLSKDQRNRMVDALEEVSYAPEQSIIVEGEAGTHFYIIVEGEVKITKAGQAAELARRSKGDYFGELSLKTGSPTIASVTAASACKLVRMDRGAFQRLLGPLDSLLALRKYTAAGEEVVGSGRDGEGGDAAYSSVPVPTVEHAFEKATAPLKLTDFTVTKGTLGEGAFGKVRRCSLKSNGTVFALKQMCKAEIVSMGQVEHIMQETKILSSISHPFVTNKYGAIVTPGNLILIMEFCPGGDLFDQLYKKKHFSLADTRVFVSQVLLPIEYLHSLGIVHRDLKLENILVAQDGSLKLTDFGFAKHIKYRSWTLCGTPEYLAPEIILEKGHGKAVDYWALGVLFYEMLNGHSPFEAEDHLATYQKVLDGTVNYPPAMNPDAVDLISKLLQKDISRRYGNLREGAKDIKEHAFFKGASFPWDAPFAMRGSIKPDEFNKSKYEWFPAEQLVTETKTCRKEDQALFDGF